MRLQTRIMAAFLPLIVLSILALGYWSVYEAGKSIEVSEYRYMEAVLDSYIHDSLERRDRTLQRTGLYGVESFVGQYQKDAITAAERAMASEEGHIAIFNRAGELLFYSDEGEVPFDPAEARARILEAVLEFPEGSMRGTLGDPPRRYLYITRYFEPWDWAVLMLLHDKAVVDANRRIKYATMGGAALASLCAVFITMVLSRRFLIEPIGLLKAAARDIKERRPVPSVGVYSADELGDLARDMKDLSDAMQDYQEKQMNWQREMQRQIELRTAELSTTNKELRQEIKIRTSAEEALAKSEQFLGDVIESIQDGIVIVDREMKILRTNRHALRWGRQKGPVESRKCYEVFFEGPERCEICPSVRTLQNGEKHMDIVRREDAGGASYWLSLSSFPLLDSRTGEAVGVIEHIRDITDMKRMEETLRKSVQEKETLIREIHHRVKNNLTIIQSLLNLQSKEVRDETAKGYLIESRNRVRSMTMIHELLYRSENLMGVNIAEYIKSISRQMLKNFQARGARVSLRIDVPDRFLDIDTMIPCGLILSELLTNSFKYAFPGGRSGVITINLTEGEDKAYTLTVRDDGVGIPPGIDIYGTTSLGMQIVTSLTRQIGGSLELVRGGGTEFRITFREKQYK